MKRCIPAVFIIILVLCLFSGCTGEKSIGEGTALSGGSSRESPLRQARSKAMLDNPYGQEYNNEKEGLYIMLPDSQWKVSTEEEGCIGFSHNTGIINIYYGDDDGSAYESVPQNADEVLDILENGQIPREWAEVEKFDLTENDGVKTYSYTIKFTVQDDNSTHYEFYSVCKSICTGDKVYVVVGQIYNESAVAACQLAAESFTVY